MTGSPFWQTVVKFDRTKLNPWLALRNTLGVTLPLASGAASGAVPIGLAIATGALNVSFSDNFEPYRVRSKRMFAACVLVGLSVFLGEATGGFAVPAVLLAGAWAFAAGNLVALSQPAADVGLISLVTLVVYSAHPAPLPEACAAGMLAFSGGLLQTALALLFWPFRRYQPERRVLGELYAELGRFAAEPAAATEAPPASARSTEAQHALGSLDRDHSVESERYRMLLSQAERMRLAILALKRLRTRLKRESEGREFEVIDRYLELASRILGAIGDSLPTGRPASELGDCPAELQTLTESLRRPPIPCPEPVASRVRDARAQMDAVTGQIRAAADLASYATLSGAADFARRESARPWRLRLSGTFATLRATLSLESAAFRHAIRLAVCVALGDAIGRGLDLSRAYWLPMTIAIILKPDFTATFSRGLLRLAGTTVGLVFSTVLFHVLPARAGAEVAALALMMFALRYFGPGNYGVMSTAVTALVVLLMALAGVPPADVIGARAINTAAGGAFALVVYAVWPTWERKQAGPVFAQMLDAYRAYFHSIAEAYFGSTVARDPIRLEARRARSNLEASIDRLAAEPGTPSATLASLSGALAASHRLVHAFMALEAGLTSSRPAPAREEFRRFSVNVERTLERLGSALRGGEEGEFPDLREDHHALLESGDKLSERYALVNVETDRIVNSLNTLRAELARAIPA